MFLIIGIGADNLSVHQSLWNEFIWSDQSHISFLSSTYAILKTTKFIASHDMPHLIRNWTYNLQCSRKIMRIGNFPVLFENLIDLKSYRSFNGTYLDPNKKMNQRAALFFFSKETIDNLKTLESNYSHGTQLYLVYGFKLWTSYQDRSICMKQRLFLASEVLSFLIIWWNFIVESDEFNSKDHFMSRGTLNASIQACLNMFTINYMFKDSEKISLCVWLLGSQK